MLLGFKTELCPNNKQRTLLAKHAGVARHAWNWGLQVCQGVFQHNQEHPDRKQKLPSAIDLHKRLVAEVKRENPWGYAPQQALRDLETALFPRFKKKNRDDSFYLEGSVRISSNCIKLPKIGWVRCYETLSAVQPKSVVVSRRAGRWFVSFHYEVEPQPTPKKIDVVGVDLGGRKLAVLSTGEVFENPHALKGALQKLRRLQRKLSRQVQGGANREKTRIRIAKVHYRIACLRANAIHQLTSRLAKNHGTIVIEDLHVRGMLRNRWLARTIADIGLYEVRRQLEYKCQLYGSRLVIADRWYPSSKRCSRCGHIHKGLGSSEWFVCSHCGFGSDSPVDRDCNAACNLVHSYLAPAVSPTVAACGATSGGGTMEVGLRATCAMKQEVGTGEPSLDRFNRLALSASSSVDQR